LDCFFALNARKYEVIKTAITTSVFAQAPSPPIRTEPNYSLLINVQRTYNPSAWEDGIFPSYASDTSQAHPHWGCGRPRPHIWPAKHGPTCKNRFFTSYALNARKYEVIKTSRVGFSVSVGRVCLFWLVPSAVLSLPLPVFLPSCSKSCLNVMAKVCSCHFLSFLFFSVILFGVLELLLYFCIVGGIITIASRGYPAEPEAVVSTVSCIFLEYHLLL